MNKCQIITILIAISFIFLTNGFTIDKTNPENSTALQNNDYYYGDYWNNFKLSKFSTGKKTNKIKKQKTNVIKRQETKSSKKTYLYYGDYYYSSSKDANFEINNKYSSLDIDAIVKENEQAVSPTYLSR